jgi:hypothetical protein
VKRRVLVGVVLLALLGAGATSAALLIRTTLLAPGQCTKVSKTRRVCAKRVTPRTVTVAPSPIGKTFSGNGSQTLAPMTLARGVNASWTATPDSYGSNYFSVTSGGSDTHWVYFTNGNNSTSGKSYIPPGTYTFNVSASGAWTLSF